MRVRFTLPALADLETIMDSVGERSPSAARGLARRVGQITVLLAQQPNVGRRTDADMIRRINLQPYPFVLFYEVLPDEVRVMAVMHGARDPASMPGGAHSGETK
jgi:plasmid stabilization system protein ParE